MAKIRTQALRIKIFKLRPPHRTNAQVFGTLRDFFSPKIYSLQKKLWKLDSQLFSPLIFFFFFFFLEPNLGFLCARALTLDLHRSEMGLGGLFIRKLNHHVPPLIFVPGLKTFLSEQSNFLSIFRTKVKKIVSGEVS